MGWTATLILFAAALALMLLARRRLAEPAEPGRVRMIPWTAVLFLAVLFAVMMLAHVLTLWGLNRP